ncbi:MAG: hypothetical protein KDA37_10815, partial [Planctomycetales bacterium]|nr:hypothetical protein [Planctomycetales bacterium]
VSALSPRQIINGKLGSALLQMLLFLSAILPCLGFTYLLRGVDLLTLTLLPALGVLASFGLSMIGAFLASLARLKALQIIISLAFIGGLFLLFFGSCVFVEEMLQRGYRYYRDEEFWTVLGAFLSFYATTFLVVYAGAVACNTFTHANRSTPIRVALLIQQSVYLGWVAALFYVDNDDDIVNGAFYVTLVYWAAAGVLLTSEQPVLSPRVRRGLPRGGLSRALFTWLMPGPGAGYFFVISNVSLCLVVMMVGAAFCDRPRFLLSFEDHESLLGPLLTCYLVAYLGLGRLLVFALRRFSDLSMLGCCLVHLLVQLLGNAGPFLARAFSRRYNDDFSYLDIPSPIAAAVHLDVGSANEFELLTMLFLVVGAAASMLMANIALAAIEIRQTRTPAPQRILEDDLELHPKLPPTPVNPWGDLPTGVE